MIWMHGRLLRSRLFRSEKTERKQKQGKRSPLCAEPLCEEEAKGETTRPMEKKCGREGVRKRHFCFFVFFPVSLLRRGESCVTDRCCKQNESNESG